MKRPTRPSQAALAHMGLIAVTLVWGTTFPLVKTALRDVSPLLFNLLRMNLAAAVLLALNWRAVRGMGRGQLKLCAAAGVLLALGYELQTVGLVYTTPAKSAFLTGLVVVLVPLLGGVPALHVAGTPLPGRLAVLGALVAFAGLVLLTSQPGTGMALLSGLHRGEWLTLVCALAFSLHLLTLAHGARAVSARALGTLQIAFAALTMLALLPLEGAHRLVWTPWVAAALLLTSLLATAAAFTVQSWAQQHLPPSHTALILTLEPVFAWLFALLFLGDRLGARALAGAGFILTGIVLAQLGPTTLSSPAVIPS